MVGSFPHKCGKGGNRLVSHMWAPLGACREPAGKVWQLYKVLYMLYAFEHKTQYLLFHAPFTCIVIFWHIGNMYPKWFRRVKFVVIPPCIVLQQYLWNIAIQPAVGCYNSWANLWCSGCSPLGEKLLWNRTIDSQRADVMALGFYWWHDNMVKSTLVQVMASCQSRWGHDIWK